MKEKKDLITVAIVFLVFLAAAFAGFLLIKNRNVYPGKKVSDLAQFPKNPKKGDPGYKEEKTSVAADGTYKFSGILWQIQNGKIYLNEKGKVVEHWVKNSDLAIECTPQSLKGAIQVDLKQVTKVVVISPTLLPDLFKVDEPMFLIAEANPDGHVRVHTVVVNESACPPGQ